MLTAQSAYGGRPHGPTLSLVQIHETERKLAPPVSVLNGKDALLVTVFATWCKPCLKEVPVLNSIARDTQGKGLRTVGISIDDLPPPNVRSWMSKHKVKYPVYYANSDVKRGSSMLGDVSGVPITLLIAPSGQILRRWLGVVPERILRAAISPIIQRKPPK